MKTQLSDYLYAPEAERVESLLDQLPWDHSTQKRVHEKASTLIEKVRTKKRSMGELESFLQEYGLNTDEGLALMTLAESLLRIPDAKTATSLIHDKVLAADWISEQGGTSDLLIKLTGMGLRLSRKTLDSALSRLGEPVIRKALVKAIRILGKQFVLGRTIEEGVSNARPFEKKGYRISYDMLGEGARTQEDADKYYDSYKYALDYIGTENKAKRRATLSVKLSALHPRYSVFHEEQCVPALTEKLLELAQMAAKNDVSLTVDAEEVDRLELSLKIIKAVASHNSIKDWNGFGLALQAYQKRALPLVHELKDFVQSNGGRMNVRLVKGAYWDTEIKRAQVMGLPDYPVFSRKANTDLSYLACAHTLMKNRDVFYPMFATHNAHTVASVLNMAGNDEGRFELQRLHGMGETLHDIVLEDSDVDVSIYAPCGSHEELLPYLVRRLLENGASTSFVYQILDKSIPIENIAKDPVNDAKRHDLKRHAQIPLPNALYRNEAPNGRVNSAGFDLADEKTAKRFTTAAIKTKVPALSAVKKATEKNVDAAFAKTKDAYPEWVRSDAAYRADILNKIADLYEKNTDTLIGYCVQEARKTVQDAILEIREAVDFCRYYANHGQTLFFEKGLGLIGPTGEKNRFIRHGRGTFVCISPWNFPLAIFTGQVTAALMAGNCVIAKPAEQTPHIGSYAISLMHKAGIPSDVLIALQGDGDIGAAMVNHKDVAGVAFTGSTEVAKLIQISLAKKDGPIVPLIAETGGQNAMIVDSSALPEQVVDDVILSAFGSAGQRCSALRVLYLQDDIADKTISMLEGAMKVLHVGDPARLSTDVGPVIDKDALKILKDHQVRLDAIGTKITQAPMAANLDGHYFAPCAYEINSLNDLEREVFGPILHIIRYSGRELDKVIEQINDAGYGLTLGIHSRIRETQKYITSRVEVGNVYINRSMTGAVVGTQPFGGMGLSGTGPKAGGPDYLHAFGTEMVVSTDTTRQGGNATLVSLTETS